MFLQLAQREQRFVDDLIEVSEFDVVALDNIEIIDPHAFQAFVHAARDAFGGEIELVHVVATALGAENETIAANLLEGFAEDFFRQCAPVVGRGVDEIHAAIERDVQRADALGLVQVAVFIADRGRAVADDGDVKSGFAQRTGLHAPISQETVPEARSKK